MTYYPVLDLLRPDSDHPDERSSFYTPFNPAAIEMPKNCILGVSIFLKDTGAFEYEDLKTTWLTEYGVKTIRFEEGDYDPEEYGVIWGFLNDADPSSIATREGIDRLVYVWVGARFSPARLWNDKAHVNRFAQRALHDVIMPWVSENRHRFKSPPNYGIASEKDKDFSIESWFGGIHHSHVTHRLMQERKTHTLHQEGVPDVGANLQDKLMAALGKKS